MTRVEQKCVIASTGLHLLLLGFLMAAPVLMNHKPPIDDSRILEFIPLMTTDLKAQGGGDPTVKDLPAAQTQPTPTLPQPPKPAPVPKREPEPEPEPVRKPEPKPAVVAQEKKDPDSLEVTTKKPPVKPQVNLTRITRNPDSRAEAKPGRNARHVKCRFGRSGRHFWFNGNSAEGAGRRWHPIREFL
jgi:outer membrane biosynthesis protein TonB